MYENVNESPINFEPDENIRTCWENVYKELRSEYGEAVFRSWLKPLTLQAFYQGTLEVSVPTRFMKDWIQRHYSKNILDLCAAKDKQIRRVEIVVVQSHPIESGPNDTQDGPTGDVSTSKSNDNKTVLEDNPLFTELTSPLDTRFTFENFVTGKSNALACAAARRVAESANVPFNPLFLYGGVGLGKTHLMHAIAWEMQRTAPEKTVLYLSAEKFMYQFVRALRSQTAMQFKEFFRSVDVLMIDDIQFIAGKETTQDEFFHTFNALVDQNKQIIISADKAPSDLTTINERLRSRLSWGLVADIQPSTYELRLGVLQKKRAAMQVEVPDSVLEFLALKIVSNIRELEGALTRIVAAADITGQTVSLETTQDVLQDLLRSHDRRITIDEIQRKVAEHYQLKLNDMHSARRARAVARPRQIAMYLSKQLTCRSLPEIGRKFGGRDHTTVMHAVKKIEELMGEDTTIAQDVEVIQRALKG